MPNLVKVELAAAYKNAPQFDNINFVKTWEYNLS